MPFDAVCNVLKVKMQVCPVELRMHCFGVTEVGAITDFIEPLFQLLNLFGLQCPQIPNPRTHCSGLSLEGGD